MYTPFQGEELFYLYLENRIAVIRSHFASGCDGEQIDYDFFASAAQKLEKDLYTTSTEAGDHFRLMLLRDCPQISEPNTARPESMTRFVKHLLTMTLEKPVHTLSLLHGLIAAQLIAKTDGYTEYNYTKGWLDRMVQRFEVTKRVYQDYQPGFRKGAGGADSIRLYWLLALVLSLYYAASNNLKYLSTLLKVCDILCSIKGNLQNAEIPEYGISLVLSAEICFVQKLAQARGISFDIK
jgi:hypothetical protein